MRHGGNHSTITMVTGLLRRDRSSFPAAVAPKDISAHHTGSHLAPFQSSSPRKVPQPQQGGRSAIGPQGPGLRGRGGLGCNGWSAAHFAMAITRAAYPQSGAAKWEWPGVHHEYLNGCSSCGNGNASADCRQTEQNVTTWLFNAKRWLTAMLVKIKQALSSARLRWGQTGINQSTTMLAL